MGTGLETFIRDPAETIRGTEGKSEVIETPQEPGDATASHAELSKIEAVIGFTSKVSIYEGIKDIYR